VEQLLAGRTASTGDTAPMGQLLQLASPSPKSKPVEARYLTTSHISEANKLCDIVSDGTPARPAGMP
jgi:hypothetical protein